MKEISKKSDSVDKSPREKAKDVITQWLQEIQPGEQLLYSNLRKLEDLMVEEIWKGAVR